MGRVLEIKVIVLLLMTTCTMGSIRNVPSDYLTIQAAIDDSNDGDIVIIAPGTYVGNGNRDIDFRGKAIKVRSEKGPENCVIDCNGTEEEPHRGFYFHSYERQNSVLEGFTITNGFAGRGGAIYCDESSPTIRNCTIISNSARLLSDGGYGGGIYCTYSDTVIKNCRIIDNKALWGTKRGADGRGGGIYCSNSNLTITGCEIWDNCKGSSSAWLSGAIHSSMSDIKISNCRFNDNESNGIYVFGGISKVEDCLITSSKYSGIRCSSDTIIRGCTIVSNCSMYEGGAIHCSSSGEPAHIELQNCIFWENGLKPLMFSNQSIANIYYCNIQGGWPGLGNIDVDPLFANPGYWDPNGTLDDTDDDFWVDGDYHLKSQTGRWDPNSQSWVKDDVTSPCIDAGDPNTPIGDEPFPNGGIINMGAYGGTAEASKSYFGEPVCETIVAGDINGDCKVDFKDFQLMALHWLEDKQ